jgi:hypothetical protein
VVAIQCLKIYHKKRLMRKKVKNEWVTGGATFYAVGEEPEEATH